MKVYDIETEREISALSKVLEDRDEAPEGTIRNRIEEYSQQSQSDMLTERQIAVIAMTDIASDYQVEYNPEA